VREGTAGRVTESRRGDRVLLSSPLGSGGTSERSELRGVAARDCTVTSQRAAPPQSLDRSIRRSSMALTATMTVETLISSAPTAGDITIPAEIATPAASGIAMVL